MKFIIVKRIFTTLGVITIISAVNVDREMADHIDFARERHHHHRLGVSMVKVRDGYLHCCGSDTFFETFERT